MGARLESWGEIASHLRRGVRTVQRWEREYQLPIHRTWDSGDSQVFAYTHELGDWWARRSDTLETDAGREELEAATIPHPRNRKHPDQGTRLDSWKAIAAYLGRGSRTVQRWEQEEGLPVLRLQHDKRGSVYAYSADLDAWMSSRKGEPRLETDREPETATRKARSIPVWALWLALTLAVLASAGVIWRALPSRSGTSKPIDVSALTSYAGCERHPSFSPDGTQIAFDWDGGREENPDIFVKVIGGESALRLTTDPNPDIHPVWSPDGRSIAFLRNRNEENDEIRVVAPIGGPDRKLAEVFSPLSDIPRPFLAWTQDSQWLVAPDRLAPSEPYRLVLISVKSGEKRPLTTPPAQSMGDSGPAISLDGRRLAFVRCITLGVCDVYAAEFGPSSGTIGTPARVTTESRILWGPMWSTSGRALMYSKMAGDLAGLWRVDWPGPSVPQVVIGSLGFHASLSRQGDKLAYSSFLHHRNIYRLDLAEARSGRVSPVRLTNSTRTDLAPEFSPDGKRLLFLSTRGATPELWLANADGSDPRQFSAFGGPPPTAPRWSPDGLQIAFQVGAQGNADIFTMPVEGGSPRRLTNDPSNESVPSWSRDGRWIYFDSDRTGRSEVWKVPSSGGAAVQITRGGGTGPIESVDGRMVFYAKTNGYRKTGLWQVPADGGNESQITSQLWSRHNFAATGDGIYLTGAEVALRRYRVLFYRFATRQLETVAETDQTVAIGLSAWPQQRPRYLLYAVQENVASDLMLVRNLTP